jgi:hypothetical protein
MGAGGVVSNEKFYVGIGIKHANRPDINFYSAESNTKRDGDEANGNGGL